MLKKIFVLTLFLACARPALSCSVGCQYKTGSGLVFAACGKYQTNAMEAVLDKCLNKMDEIYERFNVKRLAKVIVDRVEKSQNTSLNNIAKNQLLASLETAATDNLLKMVDSMISKCAIVEEPYCEDYAYQEAKAAQTDSLCKAKADYASKLTLFSPFALYANDAHDITYGDCMTINGAVVVKRR